MIPTTVYAQAGQGFPGVGIVFLPRSDTFTYTYFLGGCNWSKTVYREQNSLRKAKTAKAY
jgi:hypothetical protein